MKRLFSGQWKVADENFISDHHEFVVFCCTKILSPYISFSGGREISSLDQDNSSMVTISFILLTSALATVLALYREIEC